MSAWGNGGLAKSCNGLLKRIEDNDPSLKELIILPSKQFGSIEVKRLANAIQSNTHLISIRASGHALDHESLSILGMAISNSNSNIQHIALGDKHMGDQGIIAFCQPLKDTHGGSLIHVDFGWKDISKDGMNIIGQTFGKSIQLQYLNLSRNPKIGNDGIIQFCQSATYQNMSSPFSNLQYLDLSECQIGSIGLNELVNCLLIQPQSQPSQPSQPSPNKNLLQLKLLDNPITNHGMTSIGRLISSSKLSALILEKCQIDDDGIHLLTSSIQSKHHLTKLDLSNNSIGVLGAQTLAQSFQNNTLFWNSLQELNLAGNPIGSQGTIDLCHSIATASISTLTNLNLCQTNCGINGAIAAIQIPQLITLRLFHNQLQSDGFFQISTILSQSNIVNLDLGGNSAKKDSVAALLRSLIPSDDTKTDTDTDIDTTTTTTTTKHHPTSLRVLEIGGNEMSTQAEQIIQELLIKLPLLDIARDRPKT